MLHILPIFLRCDVALEHQDYVRQVDQKVSVILVQLTLIFAGVVGLWFLFFELKEFWVNGSHAEGAYDGEEGEEFYFNTIEKYWEVDYLDDDKIDLFPCDSKWKESKHDQLEWD